MGWRQRYNSKELHYEHLEVRPAMGMITRRTDGDRHKVGSILILNLDSQSGAITRALEQRTCGFHRRKAPTP